MKRLLLASCVAALVAAGPLAAQTPPGGAAAPQPPAATPGTPGMPGPGTGTPGPTFPPIGRPGTTPDPTAPRPPVITGSEPMQSPSDRRMEDARRSGRVTEPGPVIPGTSGEARFQADLRACETVDPASRTSCRQDATAARAQGHYR